MFTINDSRWSKDLNLRQETVKLLEENTGKKFLDVGLGSFLDLTPKIPKQQIKLKSFYPLKEMINKMNRQPTSGIGKNYLQTTLSDKGLISKMSGIHTT